MAICGAARLGMTEVIPRPKFSERREIWVVLMVLRLTLAAHFKIQSVSPKRRIKVAAIEIEKKNNKVNDLVTECDEAIRVGC